MKQPKRSILAVLLICFLLLAPSFALAEGDFEQGVGWTYQDGTLTIEDNSGLKDFVSNDQNEQTGEWKYKHSVWDVEILVIGRDVTSLVNEVFMLYQIAPKETIIESGNSYFVIENGWVINKKTKTLFGAANMQESMNATVIDNLPAYIESIGPYAIFERRDLVSINIPSGVKEIQEAAFWLCTSLKSIDLSDGLRSLGDRAFSNCSRLASIELPKQLKHIGDAAFDCCTNLESVNISNTQIDKISFDCFGACYKMQILELPESVQQIESLAFRICYAMNTLIINSSDLLIEDKAFYSCDSLHQIIFTKGTPEPFGESLFSTKGETPDGRYYISDSSEHRGMPIPYPTLFYTAAYADEWAPNGETEWNGYPIEEISQDELNAILAEARGEPVPAPIASPAPAETAEPASDAATAVARAPFAEALFAALIMALVAGIVVVAVLARKGRVEKTPDHKKHDRGDKTPD